MVLCLQLMYLTTKYRFDLAAMQKIVDSNFLQCDRLRTFLAASSNNRAVLTDYAAMEAHKGDTLKSIYKSMDILCGFPKQVVILRSTTVVCGLSGRASGLQRRLIDQNQTSQFPEYCRHLRAAQAGDQGIQKQLLEHGRVATDQIARVLKDVAPLTEVFGEMAKVFSKDEISLLRKSTVLTDPIMHTLIHNVMILAAMFFGNHPRVFHAPDVRELPNTFIFRFSLCGYLLLLEWISQGSQPNIRHEKLRNDLVDLNFAVFATFFDGLLSADKKALRIYDRAKDILHELLEFQRQHPALLSAASA
jgi:hypothetical protein